MKKVVGISFLDTADPVFLMAMCLTLIFPAGFFLSCLLPFPSMSIASEDRPVWGDSDGPGESLRPHTELQDSDDGITERPPPAANCGRRQLMRHPPRIGHHLSASDFHRAADLIAELIRGTRG